jgi:hypothetical protein
MKEMQGQGHIVLMQFMRRRETLKNIKRIVISAELPSRKYLDNSILDSDERKVFWNNWKKENHELIIDRLGRKGDCAQYLHGIYFTTLFAPNKCLSSNNYSWQMHVMPVLLLWYHS